MLFVAGNIFHGPFDFLFKWIFSYRTFGFAADLAGEVQTANEETALTRKNLLRVVAASLSFFFAGNNDGSLGALTPYILRTYNVGTEWVALM